MAEGAGLPVSDVLAVAHALDEGGHGELPRFLAEDEPLQVES